MLLETSGRDWIRPVLEHRGVIALATHRKRERAAEVLAAPQAIEHVAEIVLGNPSKRRHGPIIDIHTIDLRKKCPAVRRVEIAKLGKQPVDNARCILAQRRQVRTGKGRRRGNNIPAETDRRCVLYCQQMCLDHILDIGATIQQFICLGIGNFVLAANGGIVVRLGKEARGAQDYHRQLLPQGE